MDELTPLRCPTCIIASNHHFIDEKNRKRGLRGVRSLLRDHQLAGDPPDSRQESLPDAMSPRRGLGLLYWRRKEAGPLDVGTDADVK